ncbi:MAG: P-II family nitrogen regulator [Candidatus Methylacidiphilaceae bacterium]
MKDQPTASGSVLPFGLFQKVEAIVPRFCLGDLREALADRGIRTALVSRVKRLERAPEGVEHYLGNEYFPDFLPQTKIELVLPVDLVPAAVKTIVRKARIREPQDRILLSPILRVISIDPPEKAASKCTGIRMDTGNQQETAGRLG